LAVLMGHEKNRIKARLGEAGFAATSCFAGGTLEAYFPARIRSRYRAAVHAHPLRERIVHTVTANRLVDHFGLFAVSHLEDLLDVSPALIAQALFAAEYVLGSVPLRQAIWDGVADRTDQMRMRTDLQGHLQHFAEELIRLCPVESLTLDWMREQRQHFTRFRHMLEAEGNGISGDAPCMGYDAARAAGLSEEHAAWLCTMPRLARCGVALDAGQRLRQPLTRCLAANQAAFAVLPLYRVELQLRTPVWGGEHTHALRREWLHRLILMRSRAVTTLLVSRARDLPGQARKIWEAHRAYGPVHELAGRLAEEDPADPMEVILLLTQLESLIDETAL
jgi:glutamate dehydrogenase